MRFQISFSLCGAIAQLIAVCPSHAIEIACRDYKGAVLAIDLPSEVSFEQAMAEIQSQLPQPQFPSEYLIDFMVAAAPHAAVKEKGPVRNYKQQVTDEEKRLIAYIITTLGNASLLTIAKSRSDLKHAGAQIERIHPFRFLEYVMHDDKVRAAMQNMSKRSWLWKEYFEGIKRSLEEENSRSNLLVHVNNFASKLSISQDAIYSLIQERKWKEFLNVLLEQCPRCGNFERYDM